MTEKINKGIILMNLGSPESTEVSDAWLFRALLVKGIIVPFRAPKSAEAYKSIWVEEGSPLIVYTKHLQKALQNEISEPVEIAMRYGNPTPDAAFDSLLKRDPDIKEVIILPLYPHYAMSSYETAVEYMREIYQKKEYPFKLSFIPPFYQDADYLEALSQNMKPFLNEPYDHLLFSYHGIPERHIKKSDITGCHCLQSENCCETNSPAHAFCYRHQLPLFTK